MSHPLLQPEANEEKLERPCTAHTCKTGTMKGTKYEYVKGKIRIRWICDTCKKLEV